MAAIQSPKISATTLSLQVQEFLDNWEYRIMSSMGADYTHSEVVTSALEVLSLNGVQIDREEIDLFSKMDEHMVVEQIVDRIPLELRENFEVLSAQIQIFLNSVKAVRSSINEGSLSRVMEETIETDKMLQEVVKRSVVQASKEAAQLLRCGATWGGKMEQRLETLSKAAVFAEHAAQQLTALEMQLEQYTGDSKGKSKQAVLGMAQANDKALMKTVWSTWYGEMVGNKEAREIRQRFEKELHEAEAELYKYKEKTLSGVKQMLMSKVREGDRGLIDFAISTWYDVVQTMKRDGDTKAELEKIEAKMAAFKAESKDKQMKVFGRLVGDREQAVVVLAMNSWISFHQDYAKDKEHEEAVKKAEQALNEHLKGKKEETKKLLNKMSAATDSGLLGSVFNEWYKVLEDEKKARRMENEMAQQDVRLKHMLQSQKGKATGVAARTSEQIKENLLLRILSAWITEHKVAHVDKYYEKKIDGKKAQLKKVHTLFKSFANQLEEGLKTVDGDSSGRTNTRRTKGQGGMVKAEGSVSLPDIHAHQRTPAVA